MFSEQRRREEQALLAQDYALEQAEEKGLERGRAEGIEQGIEKGLEQGLERGKLFAFLDMVRQGLLTSEVASHQLGMSVAEFESLL
ncbi:adenylosuccinate lyase [Streptococcus pseudopneumoniae]|uniref:Adenylosuccinate lyase n=1 Tax=Streptococcus pseudopneumoniae TaxID=257758 RepID=A0A0T8UHI6_9STRE|nr:adenylosuccinate lyase [Streptococcus pseudopneumoniae]